MGSKLQSGGDWRLERVFNYVTRDLSTRPSLSELAQLVALERTYFCRYFRTATGRSFSAWHKQVRLEHAKKLLRTTKVSIGAIGAAIGYGDCTTFGRFFRKHTSLTPREYRLLQRSHPQMFYPSTITAENSSTNAETHLNAIK